MAQEKKVIRVKVEHHISRESQQAIKDIALDVMQEFTDELREVTRVFASNS